MGVDRVGLAIAWRVAREGGGTGERFREGVGDSGGVVAGDVRFSSGVARSRGERVDCEEEVGSSRVLPRVERVVVEVRRLELLWVEDDGGGEEVRSGVAMGSVESVASAVGLACLEVGVEGSFALDSPKNSRLRLGTGVVTSSAPDSPASI